MTTNVPRADARDQKLLELVRLHVPYEVQMLRGTYRRMFQPPVTQVKDRVTHNAVLESFAIHARNLMEFLSNARKEIKAKEFVDRNYVILEYPPDWREKIAHQIAHISLDRTRAGPEKLSAAWWTRFYERIEIHLDSFVRCLVEPYRSSWDTDRLLLEGPVARPY